MNEGQYSNEECQEDEGKDYDMVDMRYKKVEGRDRQSSDCRSTEHTQQKLFSRVEMAEEKKLEQGFSINSRDNQRNHNQLSNYTLKDSKDEMDIIHNHPRKKQAKIDEDNNLRDQDEKLIKQKIPSTKMNNTQLKQNKCQIKQGNPQYMHMLNPFDQRQQQYIRLRAHEMQMDRNQILHYLLATVQRNRAYECNYLHFLLPYALVLLALHTLSRDTKAYYMKTYFLVLKKLSRQEVSAQMPSNQDFDEYLHYLVKYQYAEYDKALALLTKFLKGEAEIGGRICPYYYNFFAFFANSRILFGGDAPGQLVQYTIKYHYRYYDHHFTEDDVKREIHRLEKEMATSYKSREI